MTVPGNLSSPLLATAAAAGAAAGGATRSLRFNSGDSASLTKTFSAGNRSIWTWSGWVKKTKVGGSQILFSSFTGSASDYIIFSNDSIAVQLNSSNNGDKITTRKLRDCSSWYHIIVAADYTSSTPNDRIKIYINGVLEDDFSTNTAPGPDYQGFINHTYTHAIGSVASSTYLDGYLADVYFIDGSQLSPTSFGAYDDNGVWQAAAYSGTFGTNGFHLLDFENESTIGHDSSGNNNDFTANNLTESALVPNQGFDVVTYTGNGSSSQSITSLGFQPDFVWIKPLVAGGYVMQDVVRGTGNKVLSSHSTGAEGAETYGQIQSFDSNGFTVEAGSTSAENSNHSGRDYVAWCWKAGGAASSNTDGSITSSVSASSTYGSSIVSWTGTGANASVGHGLSSAPKWVLVKNRSATASWAVWHTALSGSQFFGLNTTNAIQSSSAYWNSSTPTASVINVGTDSSTNGSSNNMIAYCWEEKSGFSKFGSYTGNGSTSGPTITGLGFKPRFVLIKGDVAGEDWVIVDTVRSPSNPNKKLISPNSSSQEFTHSGSAYDMDIDDDGFTVKNTNPRWNTNGETYIWAAFGSGSGSPEDLDVLFDVPVNGNQTDSGAGGEVSGNYATLNPLDSGSGVTLSNGNLSFSSSGGSQTAREAQGTIAMPASGKYYFEVKVGTVGEINIGLKNKVSGNLSVYYRYNSNNFNNVYIDGSNNNRIDSYTDGDVIGVAYDSDDQEIRFYKNGTALGSEYSLANNGQLVPHVSHGSSSGSASGHVNFGARAFSYAAPSGYKALNTASLPTPTIADGSTAFDVRSGLTAQFTISDLKFAADLIWGKSTSNNEYWIAANSLDNFANGLKLNETSAEGSGTPVTNVTATGYQSSNNWFTTGRTYVTFNWDGGNLATNTAYNQADVWSDRLSGTVLSSSLGYKNAFDGDTSTATHPANGNTITFTPSTAISVTSSIKIYFQIGSITGISGTADITINGTSYVSNANSGRSNGHFTVTGVSSITSIAWERAADNDLVVVTAIEVDGKKLVDAGVIPASSVSSGVPSIASTVRANPTAGFSIVTASPSNNAVSIGHGLNVAPSMIISKSRTVTYDWNVFHASLGGDEILRLNTDAATQTVSGYWNNVGASTFSVASGNNANNSGDMIYYCFAPVAGYSAFGKYTGNGSSEGPFVHTGFRPAFLLFFATDGTHKVIYDSARDTDNPVSKQVATNLQNSESDQSRPVDFLSNGFKVRFSSYLNDNNDTIVYACFAENPFQANGGLAR